MPAPLALNDAGFGQYATSAEADVSMTSYSTRLATALSVGCDPSRVYVSPDIYQSLLAPGLRVSDWLRGSPQWSEAQAYVLSLLDSARNPNGLDSGDSYACVCEGVESDGLLAAHTIQGMLASESCSSPWDSSVLDVELVRLDESRHPGQVVHCGSNIHIRQSHDWLKTRLFDGTTPTDLWLQRDRIFPFLRFSDMSVRFMPHTPNGHHGLARVEERLFELNAYASRRGAAFDEEEIPFDIRGEGGETMKRFGAEREAVCADGVRREFRSHCYLDDGWRMYFRPDEHGSWVHIGLIGPHPHTVTGYS